MTTTVAGVRGTGVRTVAECSRRARVTVGDGSAGPISGTGAAPSAAFVDGECVVDVWAGGPARARAWAEDTRAVIMSATKGLTTLCAHLLEDRGELDLDAPVVRVLARVRRRRQGGRPRSGRC